MQPMFVLNTTETSSVSQHVVALNLSFSINLLMLVLVETVKPNTEKRQTSCGVRHVFVHIPYSTSFFKTFIIDTFWEKKEEAKKTKNKP